MSLLTCSKTFADIPFAHRQSNHVGHCRQIHGHNWAFTFVFSGEPDPATGFILDFGGPEMQELKREVNRFDHACVLNADDENGRRMVRAFPGLFSVVWVPNCSCEGLATYLLEMANALLSASTEGRVRVISVTVTEDSRNSATVRLHD